MQLYEKDINAWANEQARFLRAGRFDLLDVEHLADEIEDVGKSEQRELARCAVRLLAHLLTWKAREDRRGAPLEKTIRAQRKQISYSLAESPSLAAKMQERRWLDVVWTSAVAQAVNETGLDHFPEQCPWAMHDEILAATWLPR